MKSEAKRAAARRFANRKRAERVAASLCGSCGKPAEAGHATCKGCLEYQATRTARLKEEGRCTDCQVHCGARVCLSCASARAFKSRERKAARKLQGLCQCGRPLRRGRHNCQVCHDTRPSRKHGLTRIQTAELIEAQLGMCKLCGCGFDLSVGGKRPHVDHCHETGRIRGVLCQKCNIVLGGLEALKRGGLLSPALAHVGLL